MVLPPHYKIPNNQAYTCHRIWDIDTFNDYLTLIQPSNIIAFIAEQRCNVKDIELYHQNCYNVYTVEWNEEIIATRVLTNHNCGTGVPVNVITGKISDLRAALGGGKDSNIVGADGTTAVIVRSLLNQIKVHWV